MTRAFHCSLSGDSRSICLPVRPWPELSTTACPVTVVRSVSMSVPDPSFPLQPVRWQSFDLSPCPSLTRALQYSLSGDSRSICPHVHPWPECRALHFCLSCVSRWICPHVNSWLFIHLSIVRRHVYLGLPFPPAWWSPSHCNSCQEILTGLFKHQPTVLNYYLISLRQTSLNLSWSL